MSLVLSTWSTIQSSGIFSPTFQIVCWNVQLCKPGKVSTTMFWWAAGETWSDTWSEGVPWAAFETWNGTPGLVSVKMATCYNARSWKTIKSVHLVLLVLVLPVRGRGSEGGCCVCGTIPQYLPFEVCLRFWRALGVEESLVVTWRVVGGGWVRLGGVVDIWILY